MRSVKTDFVSCPSCGRTLFDLQEVTEQIKQKTGHLPGVAIAIMVRFQFLGGILVVLLILLMLRPFDVKYAV